MTVEQWFAVLNERVFFFLQRKRLDALLGAYKREPQLVITLDTASLVAAYESRIELCKFNSGFAQPHAEPSKPQSCATSHRSYRSLTTRTHSAPSQTPQARMSRNSPSSTPSTCCRTCFGWMRSPGERPRVLRPVGTNCRFDPHIGPRPTAPMPKSD
jgi:hypothetical protein